MKLLTTKKLQDEVHSIMQRSPGFGSFINAIAVNCRLNAENLINSYDFHDIQAGEAWINIARQLNELERNI